MFVQSINAQEQDTTKQTIPSNKGRLSISYNFGWDIASAGRKIESILIDEGYICSLEKEAGGTLSFGYYFSDNLQTSILFGTSNMGHIRSESDTSYWYSSSDWIDINQYFIVPSVKYEYKNIFDIDIGAGISWNVLKVSGFSVDYRGGKSTSITAGMYGGSHVILFRNKRIFNLRLGFASFVSLPTKIGDIKLNSYNNSIDFSKYKTSYWSIRPDIAIYFKI